MKTISDEEYTHLRKCHLMLSQIAGYVARYARTPETTTLECVVAMDRRVKKLNKRVRKMNEQTK